MSNKSPTFQFYAQDFLTGVMYLTNEEVGIYIKMLAKQWTDGKIPKKRLGFLVGYDWDILSDELKSKFIDNGSYLVNERLEKEREKKSKFIKKQSENGKKGGRPRKVKEPEPLDLTDKETQIKPKPFKNINPNESQKKPLEDEDEIEDEKEIENRKMKIEKKAIVFPFENEEFRAQWKLWKLFKQKEFGFKYKSELSEQGALKKLSDLSQGDQKTAIKIIHQSISEGWKGLFKLKNDANRNNTHQRTDIELKQSASDAVDRMFGR